MVCISVLYMLKVVAPLVLPGEASIMDKRLQRLSHQMLDGTHIYMQMCLIITTIGCCLGETFFQL